MDYWSATLYEHETEDGLLLNDTSVEYCRNYADKVTIPKNVTCIKGYVFEDCDSLTSVTIGNRVKYIHQNAFFDTHLQTLICKFNEIPQISSNTFSTNMFNHTQVYVPEGTYWNYAFSGWGNFIRIKEMATDAEELEMSKAYMIADASGMNYTVYDIRKGKLVNVAFTHSLDEECEGSCWTVLKDGNALHLYNIGAKKYGFVTEDGNLVLSDVPVRVDIANVDGGLSINGNARMFVLNNKITFNADGIDQVKAKTRKVASDLFDLSGRRLQRVQKGVYIHNGRKMLVK